MKKPAHRGATAGLSKSAVAANIERYALEIAPRQDLYLARRFGLSPALAVVVAELAYPALDTWRGRA